MNIGQAIRALRQKRNMTQSKLAAHVGMSVNAISSWELGKSNPPKESVALICDAFHVPVSYLMLSTIEEKDIPEDKRVLYRALLEPLKNELLNR
nr:MAG TPA: helix-turn-helix domain protein [Caudoviricetes sp.]